MENNSQSDEIPSSTHPSVEELLNLVDQKMPINDFLNKIKTLSEVSLENQLSLGSEGFCEALCPLLTQAPYGEDSVVVEELLWTIVKLCRRELNKSTACPENCERIIMADGGKFLLEALSNHILESVKVNSVACYLIMVLASDSNDRQRHLAQCGAALALAAVLFKFSDNIDIAEWGCRAVRNLASDDEVAAAMVSEGICEALVKVLKDCATNETIVEQALWAIVNLTCDSGISTVFGSAGGCRHVVDAINSFMQCSSIVDAGSACIRNISSDSQYSLSIFAHLSSPSVTDVLYKSLFMYFTDSDICETVLWACANIASCEKLASELVDFGLLSLVFDILNNRTAPMLGQNKLQDQTTSFASSSATLEDDEDISLKEIEAAIWLLRNIRNSAPNKFDKQLQSHFMSILRTVLGYALSRFNAYSSTLVGITVDAMRGIVDGVINGPVTLEEAIGVTDDIILDHVNQVLASEYSTQNVPLLENCLKVIQLFASSTVPGNQDENISIDAIVSTLYPRIVESCKLNSSIREIYANILHCKGKLSSDQHAALLAAGGVLNDENKLSLESVSYEDFALVVAMN